MTRKFVLYITGGYGPRNLDDVLAYVQETSDWKKIGSMKNTRRYHAASLVKMAEVFDYCKVIIALKEKLFNTLKEKHASANILK